VVSCTQLGVLGEKISRKGAKKNRKELAVLSKNCQNPDS
jgi:hypothetical protein